VLVKVYEPVGLYGLSEDDKLAVVLTVKDWKAILDNMREDADALGDGPAVTALIADADQGRTVNGTDFRAAYEHDAARCAAYSCAASTGRCADVLEETLLMNGWPG